MSRLRSQYQYYNNISPFLHICTLGSDYIYIYIYTTREDHNSHFITSLIMSMKWFSDLNKPTSTLTISKYLINDTRQASKSVKTIKWRLKDLFEWIDFTFPVPDVHATVVQEVQKLRFLTRILPFCCGFRTAHTIFSMDRKPWILYLLIPKHNNWTAQRYC